MQDAGRTKRASSMSTSSAVTTRKLDTGRPSHRSEHLTRVITENEKRKSTSNASPRSTIAEAKAAKVDDVRTSAAANTTSSVAGTSSSKPPRIRASKAVRQARREDAALKAMYAPKDSRIQLITPATMELMSRGKVEHHQQQKSNSKIYTSSQNKDGHSGSAIASTAIVTVNGNNPVDEKPRIETEKEIQVWPLDKDFPTLATSAVSRPRRSLVLVSNIEDEGWETEQDVIKQSPLPTNPKSKRKPSKNPFVINLEELLVSSSSAQKQGPKISKRKPATELGNKFRAVGNLLDSSGLTCIRRGKIREVPKTKRPTKLKKAILITRSLRKVTIGNHFAANAVTASVPLDDSTPNSSELLHQVPQTQVHGDEVEVSRQNSEPVSASVEDDAKADDSLPSHLPSQNPEEPDNIFKKLFDDALVLDTPVIQESSKLSPRQIPTEVITTVNAQKHSKKFRSYCDMYISKELHGYVIAIMKELHRFQDRLYHSNPMKFQTSRRYVHGLKDVCIHMQLNKIQLLILAPDIESNDVEGGLDEKIAELVCMAKNNEIPYVFSGNRYILGKPMKIKNRVSAIGILNKQGTEELVLKLLMEAKKLRDNYTSDFMLKVDELMIRH